MLLTHRPAAAGADGARHSGSGSWGAGREIVPKLSDFGLSRCARLLPGSSWGLPVWGRRGSVASSRARARRRPCLLRRGRWRPSRPVPPSHPTLTHPASARPSLPPRPPTPPTPLPFPQTPPCRRPVQRHRRRRHAPLHPHRGHADSPGGLLGAAREGPAKWGPPVPPRLPSPGQNPGQMGQTHGRPLGSAQNAVNQQRHQQR